MLKREGGGGDIPSCKGLINIDGPQVRPSFTDGYSMLETWFTMILFFSTGYEMKVTGDELGGGLPCEEKNKIMMARDKRQNRSKG